MVLLQTALDIHRKKAHVSLQPFHAHMEQRFEQMKEFVEKEYSIKVGYYIIPALLTGGGGGGSLTLFKFLCCI